MYELSQIILWILWRLRPAMAVEANLVGIIESGFGMFADDEELAWLASDPRNCARVMAAFADSLAQLDLLIYLRACEIAGLPSRSNGFQPNFNAPGSHHTPQSCWRIFRNLVHRFEDRERLAHLRAERMRREASLPLRLDAPHQATSPALCAVEATHRCLLAVPFASTSATHWGRWIGASSRRDGGGSRAARGPPPSTHSENQHPHLALTCENAHARLPQSLPRRLLKTSGDPLAKSTKREHNREQERSKNMTNGAVNFCGANGNSYKFERFGAEQDWAKVAGVVLFAAPEGKSWRIIRVADQGGVEGDVATFWRWREARRYGASAIFIRRNVDLKSRRAEAADLAQGLDPVFASGSELAREPELMAA